MVKKQLSENIIKITKSFRDLLVKSKIPVHSMIVFGSYAKGNERLLSDIDVCVVSNSFGENSIEDMQMLFKKARHIDSRLEPYPMNPRDLQNTQNPIVSEIITWGVLV